ncbi:MAG: glycerol-3-phosphate dehydrogenase/oxidase [Candidatus Heimdallarchaeota archaeon]|nr:glycerol-3-phosphate dehydrogenase/oxidase [Candidatus Heimdallarchaeota archaeon]
MSTLALENRKKKILQLKSEEYDVLVVGAGITGAGIAWDASLRGLKVAIIDKEDFGAGTSSGSSKLVHAGIRYLAYGEFSLVRHASRERMWMFKSCPHQAEPIPFLIPIYKKGKNTLAKMLFAGTLYDILAKFKNTENYRFLSRKKTLELVPNIKNDVLKRSMHYWDGIMDDARITLETILTAQNNGAIAINHIKSLEFLLDNNSELGEIVKGVKVEDTLTGDVFSIKAKLVVNSTGPWTEIILNQFKDSKKLLRTTKGIHIITKRIVKNNVVVVITADDERGMFVIPFRRKYSLIGTTDTDYKDNMDHVEITNEDIDYVISAVNNDFPNSLTRDDVISAYSGVRPMLLSPKAKSETDTSRGFEIIKTKPNLLTVTGGKYTIFRYMAEKTVDEIISVLRLNKKDHLCKTKKNKLHGANSISSIKEYLLKYVPALMKKHQLPIDIADHIIHTYGSAHIEILDIINQDEKMKERIADKRPHIFAEIIHAIDYEMCLTLSDFMLRRTQLQLLESQGLDCIEKIADAMASKLGWSENEKKKQIDNYKKDLTWKQENIK